MNQKEMHDMHVLQSMTADPTHWNSWGSPFGIAMFFLTMSLSLVALGVFVWLLHTANIIH